MKNNVDRVGAYVGRWSISAAVALVGTFPVAFSGWLLLLPNIFWASPKSVTRFMGDILMGSLIARSIGVFLIIWGLIAAFHFGSVETGSGLDVLRDYAKSFAILLIAFLIILSTERVGVTAFTRMVPIVFLAGVAAEVTSIVLRMDASESLLNSYAWREITEWQLVMLPALAVVAARRLSTLVVICLVVAGIGIALTGQRTAWVAVGVLMVMLAVSHRAWKPISIYAAAFVCSIALLAGPLQQIKAGNSVAATIGRGAVLDDRLMIWREVYGLVLQRPVLGFGPARDTFAREMASRVETNAAQLSASRDGFPEVVRLWFVPPHPHNMYLWVAFAAGIFGLAGYCGIVIAGGLAILSSFKSSSRVIASLGCSVVSIYGIYGLSECPRLDWLSIALAVSICSQRLKRSAVPHAEAMA